MQRGLQSALTSRLFDLFDGVAALGRHPTPGGRGAEASPAFARSQGCVALRALARPAPRVQPASPSAPNCQTHQILETVRPLAARQGLETPLQLWGFFVARTRSNLHVLLALSPAGGAFRERLRANPALVNCCTIDWFWQVGGGGLGPGGRDRLRVRACKLATQIQPTNPSGPRTR